MCSSGQFPIQWRLTGPPARWCSQVLSETLATYPAPAIFNTDQGSQFTADVFTALLVRANVQISMDGKGRALDNIFIERLWRRVKYEPGRRADIYLKAYTDGWQLEAGLQAYFEFYNCRRFHQGLAYQTPEQVLKGKKQNKQSEQKQ